MKSKHEEPPRRWPGRVIVGVGLVLAVAVAVSVILVLLLSDLFGGTGY